MKTACEEAADKFEEAAEWLDVPALDDFSGLPKRLRAEGRELKRLREEVEELNQMGFTHANAAAQKADQTELRKLRKFVTRFYDRAAGSGNYQDLVLEAARIIQKARKAK